MKMVIRSKETTAWAEIIGDYPIVAGATVWVFLYDSNRVKRPKKVRTSKPETVIIQHFKSMKSWADTKKANKSNNSRALEVGDILVSKYSDQPDFYRVTKLVGKVSVMLERLRTKAVTDRNEHGVYSICPNLESPAFVTCDCEKSHRVTDGVNIKIGKYSEYLTKWDGKPQITRPYYS